MGGIGPARTTDLEWDERAVNTISAPTLASAQGLDEQATAEDTAWSTPSTLASYVALAGILVAGFAIRLLLFPHGVFEGDAQTFRTWAVRLASAPLSDFYASARSADHLPGDLWFLWGIAHLYRWYSPAMNVHSAGFLYLLKLVPAVADAGIGLLLFVIARGFAGPRAGLLAAALFMFNPASIFLTATWGQWDSISAFFMLVGIWLLLRGNPEWSLPAFTYAALIKPQLGALLVLAGLAWWCWTIRSQRDPGTSRDGLRDSLGRLALGVLASIAVFLALDLPFNVGLPLLPARWSIFERMSYALNRHQSISANAFNLWGVFGRSSNTLSITDSHAFMAGLSYQHWGEILLGAAVLTALLLFWLRPDRSMALWASLAITFSLFMLPTRIHERYLMPAVVLALLVSAIAPNLRWLGIALSLTYFANIVYVYHYLNQVGFGGRGTNPNDLIPLGISTVNVFLLLVVFAAGFVLASGSSPRDERQTIQAYPEDLGPSVWPLQSLPGANTDSGLPEGRV